MVRIRALLLIALGTLATDPASAEWRYHETTDEMTGEIDQRFVVTYSENEHEGWLDSGPLMLGFDCAGSVYMRANEMGLEYESFATRDHPSRVRFDDGSIETYTWTVWEDNHDGATLSEADDEFILSVSRSDRLMIEVKLFGIDGRKQVAQFDLTGFLEAYKQCSGVGKGSSGVGASGGAYVIENCTVRSFGDDLTDRLRDATITCGAERPVGGVMLFAYFDERRLAKWVLWFLDADREFDVPDDDATVEVTFRIDDAPPVRLDTAVWSADIESAGLVVDDRSAISPVLDAKTLIYRIGTFGDVHRIAIPEAMPALFAEFLSRVESAMSPAETQR